MGVCVVQWKRIAWRSTAISTMGEHLGLGYCICNRVRMVRIAASERFEPMQNHNLVWAFVGAPNIDANLSVSHAFERWALQDGLVFEA